jgi:hypothetical protein
MPPKRLFDDLNSHRFAGALASDRITLALSRINGSDGFGAFGDKQFIGSEGHRSFQGYGAVHETGFHKTAFACELELLQSKEFEVMGTVLIERFEHDSALPYLSVRPRIWDEAGAIRAAIYNAFNLANAKGGQFIHVTLHRAAQDATHERKVLPKLGYTSPAAITYVVVHQQGLLPSAPRWAWQRPWRGYPLT